VHQQVQLIFFKQLATNEADPGSIFIQHVLGGLLLELHPGL
jgi:hypothetical protein